MCLSRFWLTTERYKEPDNWTEENENGEDCARMGERSTVNIRIWYDASCEKPLKRVCEALAATPSRASLSLNALPPSVVLTVQNGAVPPSGAQPRRRRTTITRESVLRASRELTYRT
ncbi:hypothetical protein Z043_120195 [Scleropages formosus]|uniref:C-type lectin domain-containing protein n=1 Tax=Scleropages formosus TaxID=113540 RepID=A0A0P7U3V7_SCLFO|nr:hypothetical protein Z043_120195 [Scleropages formosus]